MSDPVKKAALPQPKRVAAAAIASKLEGAVYGFHRYQTTFRFFVSHPKDVIMSHHVRGVLYEEEELELMAAAYGGGAVLDLGANVGNHTVFFSKVMRADLVIPIEPNPVAYEVLKVNALLNACDGVDLSYLGLALGAADSLVTGFTAHDVNLGHTVYTPASGAGTDCRPGDALFGHVPFTLVKIDIEGMEFEALEGLSLTLQRWKPTIFIEIWDNVLDRFKLWCGANGYEIAATYRRYREIDNFLIYHRSKPNPLGA